MPRGGAEDRQRDTGLAIALDPLHDLSALDYAATVTAFLGVSNNHYAYSNPEVDALMAKARSTIDEGARVATFRKLQELIYRDAPLRWIYHQTEILAMSKRVKGYPDLSVRDALPWAHQIAAP
jgi:ABC-type transport system substrate-binding protein